MTVTAGDALLFIFGLVPQYVSVIMVEKHYTNFWTGFWNIYGLIQVVVSLVVSSDDISLIIPGIFIVIILIAVLYISTLPGAAVIARGFGASLITTSVSWCFFAWFLSGQSVIGLFVGALHALVLIILKNYWHEVQHWFAQLSA